MLIGVNLYLPVTCHCCWHFSKLSSVIYVHMGSGFIVTALVLTGLMLYMYVRLLKIDPGMY